jgi:hypothetical protein
MADRQRCVREDPAAAYGLDGDLGVSGVQAHVPDVVVEGSGGQGLSVPVLALSAEPQVKAGVSWPIGLPR